MGYNDVGRRLDRLPDGNWGSYTLYRGGNGERNEPNPYWPFREENF
jgi:hypothetical protein